MLLVPVVRGATQDITDFKSNMWFSRALQIKKCRDDVSKKFSAIKKGMENKD